MLIITYANVRACSELSDGALSSPPPPPRLASFPCAWPIVRFAALRTLHEIQSDTRREIVFDRERAMEHAMRRAVALHQSRHHARGSRNLQAARTTSSARGTLLHQHHEQETRLILKCERFCKRVEEESAVKHRVSPRFALRRH